MTNEESDLVGWWRDQCVQRFSERHFPREHGLLALIDRLARVEEASRALLAEHDLDASGWTGRVADAVDALRAALDGKEAPK